MRRGRRQLQARALLDFSITLIWNGRKRSDGRPLPRPGPTSPTLMPCLPVSLPRVATDKGRAVPIRQHEDLWWLPVGARSHLHRTVNARLRQDRACLSQPSASRKGPKLLPLLGVSLFVSVVVC